jgi:hypothetical protein
MKIKKKPPREGWPIAVRSLKQRHLLTFETPAHIRKGSNQVGVAPRLNDLAQAIKYLLRISHFEQGVELSIAKVENCKNR